uniref:(northern house mosquito) hypothetical protein n=1 Tax=Culex pipiens TaxID=7175 RepID=A0A8D8EZJ7_CULPI
MVRAPLVSAEAGLRQQTRHFSLQLASFFQRIGTRQDVVHVCPLLNDFGSPRELVLVVGRSLLERHCRLERRGSQAVRHSLQFPDAQQIVPIVPPENALVLRVLGMHAHLAEHLGNVQRKDILESPEAE